MELYWSLGPDEKSIVQCINMCSIDGQNAGYSKMDVLAKGLDNLTHDLRIH